jgi:DNA polymerase-3 subunit delta
VHTVTGAHFNWSGLLGAAQAMSLFADKQLIEIRIPRASPARTDRRRCSATARACRTTS